MKLQEGTPEWRQWGANEQARRNQDIRAAHDAASLERAQAAARERRRAVGLSEGEVIRAMKAARLSGVQAKPEGAADAKAE